MPSPRRPRLRFVVEGVIGVTLAGLAVRTWLVAGLLVPFEVASGSMAQTLLGPHYRLVCSGCGLELVCGADVPPSVTAAVCPQCGWKNDLSNQAVVPGDGILIVRGAFWIRSPRRWEPVAFNPAHSPCRLAVKRVVGLPGETVRILEGDVYINGRIARKSLGEQLAVAQLIYSPHDLTLRPAGPFPGWRQASSGSLWSNDRGVFRHPADPAAADFDWLVFQGVERDTNQGGKVGVTSPVPVTDWTAYNQTRLQRGLRLQPVSDLLCTFWLRAAGQGRFELRAVDGQRTFRFLWEKSWGRSHYQAFDGQQPVPLVVDLRPLPEGRDLAVAVSLIDRQFLVAIGGKPVVAYPYERGGLSATEKPFSIGVQGMEVEIRELRVYRDVQYGAVAGGMAHWGIDEPVTLGPDEFFVLGDNSAISVDSRVWATGPAVHAEQIVGRPLVVHFPVRLVRLGGFVIQVPAWSRIRYIR